MTQQQIIDKISEIDSFLKNNPDSDYNAVMLQDKQDLQTKLDTKDYE